MLHSESQTPQHLDGAGFATLEVTGGKPLTGGVLVRRAQDCLVRVAALLPDQLVRRRRSEPVLGEELLGSEPIAVAAAGLRMVEAVDSTIVAAPDCSQLPIPTTHSTDC